MNSSIFVLAIFMKSLHEVHTDFLLHNNAKKVDLHISLKSMRKALQAYAKASRKLLVKI